MFLRKKERNRLVKSLVLSNRVSALKRNLSNAFEYNGFWLAFLTCLSASLIENSFVKSAVCWTMGCWNHFKKQTPFMHSFLFGFHNSQSFSPFKTWNMKFNEMSLVRMAYEQWNEHWQCSSYWAMKKRSRDLSEILITYLVKWHLLNAVQSLGSNISTGKRS